MKGVPYKQASHYADGVYGPDDLAAVWNACVNAHKALAQQPAAVDGDWRKKAAEWLEAKAVEQEAANQKWPSHAACYKEWRDRPGILRHLAIQVLAAQPGEE